MQCCHFAVDFSAVEVAPLPPPMVLTYSGPLSSWCGGPSGADRRKPPYPLHGLERRRHRAVDAAARRERPGGLAADARRTDATRASCRAACSRRVAADLAGSATWSRSSWRARLSEQLGNYSGELREAHAARALDDAAELAGLSCRLRPDRCGAARARAASGDVRRLPCLAGRARPSRLACDLRPAGARAAAGAGLRPRPRRSARRPGATEDLAYVSPKTGRAVSRAPPPAPTRRS